MYDEDDYLAKAPDEPMPYERTDNKYESLIKERDEWKQLCKDIVTIMGKDPYYLRVGMDIWIDKTIDHFDQKKKAEFYKLSDSIHARLEKIKWD